MLQIIGELNIDPDICGCPKFECKHLHKNDTNDRLQILGHWILRMAEISDERKALGIATWNARNENFLNLGIDDWDIKSILNEISKNIQIGYQVEPRNTTGRRKHNIVVHKLLSLLEHQKKDMQTNELTINSNSQNSQIENNNVSAEQLHEQVGTKCQHRVTNNNEKKILKDLLKYDNFPEDKAIKILRQL
ncbi:24402_t:CDS:2 [Cetraspora pellucida]|uniref:24402_t:CDS:1 n=1 Tax=Cetraspora pellucida TaxID=1433469 RepID=A0A9N9I338_9GLOM|nr:24402_t:CDS:2 [Cetraspora pellucida]